MENFIYTKILAIFDLSVGADFSPNDKLPHKLSNSNLAFGFDLSAGVALSAP
jgi:hypothetical protein